MYSDEYINLIRACEGADVPEFNRLMEKYNRDLKGRSDIVRNTLNSIRCHSVQAVELLPLLKKHGAVVGASSDYDIIYILRHSDFYIIDEVLKFKLPLSCIIEALLRTFEFDRFKHIYEHPQIKNSMHTRHRLLRGHMDHTSEINEHIKICKYLINISFIGDEYIRYIIRNLPTCSVWETEKSKQMKSKLVVNVMEELFNSWNRHLCENTQ